MVAAELSGIWSYLSVTLQLADYALVAGTAALFAVLGAVMYCTRRIDWYPEREGGEAPGEPPPGAMGERCACAGNRGS